MVLPTNQIIVNVPKGELRWACTMEGEESERYTNVHKLSEQYLGYKYVS